MKGNFIIDYLTKNKSFIDIHEQLTRMGVNNNDFFLMLFDEGLQNIDPYDPSLSNEYMVRILNECRINIWYYLREVARFPREDGSSVPFELNLANLASIWCFINNIDQYIVTPSGTCRTQSIIAMINWSYNLGSLYTSFSFLGKRMDDAYLNIDRLKNQRDVLPHYFTALMVNKTDNLSQISNHSGNIIYVKPSAKSKRKAEQIGRSMDYNIQLFDDVEFCDHIQTIISSSAPAYKSMKMNNRSKDRISCRIFSSTVGNLNTEPGRDAMGIIDMCCTWNESLYDLDREDIKTYLKKNSLNDIIYIEYSYKQLGKDQDWFDDRCRMFNNNQDMIDREILLKRH